MMAVIDFLDLELLAENYRQTGPTAGSSSILGLLQKIKPTAISSLIPGPIKTVIAPMATSSPVPGPITNRDRSHRRPDDRDNGTRRTLS